MIIYSVMANMKHRVLVTGAAGYVGAMLILELAQRDDVEKVLAIDKDPESDLSSKEYRDKIVYLQSNLAHEDWKLLAAEIRPNIIIHAAWQIREIYGRRDISWLYNIVASDKVFDFAFENKYVQKLIHFSTVASYGAMPDNSLDYRYEETDELRRTVYLYAEEKRIAEEHLKTKWLEARNNSDADKKSSLSVSIVRPASITGPRLRNQINKFSLQSALSGSLKKQKGFLNKLVGHMTAFMPATHGWLRQYIHEDDVVGIVMRLAFDNNDDYEVYNLCPPGEAVYARDMARALHKRPINIHPRLIQLVFSIFWHMTRGRVPTAPGVWKGYSYPIGVSGDKVIKRLDYQYQYNSLEALTTDKGKYGK